MRVVDELPPDGHDDVESLVLTGDGRGEYRRLKYITPKYNGDKILFFPSRPERHLSIVGKQQSPGHVQQKGLDALDALAVFKGKYGYTSFLFLTDLEHISPSTDEEIAAELDRTLVEVSSNDSAEVVPISKRSFVCGLKIGSSNILVLAAIIGDEFECFEDGLATLLELEWGNEIDCNNRQELKSTLADILSGSNEKTLLEGASRHSIEQSFPHLTSVLREYE